MSALAVTPPTVASFTPSSGGIGATVTIIGSGFVSPATVSFNGAKSGAVKVVSGSKITATVPSTASTGPITVSDAGGAVTSSGTFSVAPSMALSLTSGPPTTTTTVKFAGFSAYEAVDLYVDTTDVGLVSASAGGTAAGSLTIPATTRPGTHWISAVGRHSGYSAQAVFTVRTNWTQFGYGANKNAVNSYENVLSPSTVAGLSPEWTVQLSSLGSSAPVVYNGTVYVAALNGAVCSFNEATGTQNWCTTPGGSINASVPALSAGGTVLYIGSTDGNLYALNTSNGTTRWTATTGNAIFSSPVVSGADVYIGSNDDNVYAFNATTGAKVWSYTTSSAVESSPAVVNGVVYVGSNDGYVYALNAASGAALWFFATGSYVQAAPVVVGGRVYVGSADSSMYALRASNGSQIWSYASNGAIYTSAAVVGGNVYFGTRSGSVYSLNAGSGALDWSDPVSSSIGSSITIADGVVYADDGASLYLLSTASGAWLTGLSAGTQYYDGAIVVDGAVLAEDDLSHTLTRYTLDPGNTPQSVRPDLRTLRAHPAVNS